MKICMLAYTFYESDNRVRRYAEALSGRGDSVEVISLRRERQPAEAILNGVKIFRIQKRVVNERGKLLHLLRHLLFFVKSSIFLMKKSIMSRYDVIHVHTMPDFEVFAAWFPKCLGARVILDLHEMVPEFYANKFNVGEESIIFRTLKFIEKASVRFADHVIIVNHLLEKRLVSRSVKQEKCTTFINYPEGALFNTTYEKPKSSRFVMIYPGSLNRHQGLDIAVKGFYHVKDRLPDAEFHIYGEGSAQSELQTLIQELNLGSKVFLKGSLPFSEMVRVMAKADLGIVPKRADSYGNEAFSTKIFEFMALRVPVIASDTRIDKYYFNDSNIRFFKSGDEKNLADAMFHLAKNPAIRERMVENGYRHAVANSWEVKKHDYLSLVDRLTGQGQV
ncbi:MAG: glycosyltransferase family 4 protein [Nitrospirota bacterium]